MRHFIIAYSIVTKTGSFGFGNCSWSSTAFPNNATVLAQAQKDDESVRSVVISNIMEVSEMDLKSFQDKKSLI